MQGGELFFIVWKNLAPGQYKPVYKSEAQPQQRGKQVWRDMVIDTGLLCNNDRENEFRVDFMQASDDGNHRLVGSASACLEQLVQGNLRQLQV